MFAWSAAEPQPRRSSGGAGEEQLLAGECLRGRRADLHGDDLARASHTLEVHDLVVADATAQARRVGARGALDEHVERAPDEALGALARARMTSSVMCAGCGLV